MDDPRQLPVQAFVDHPDLAHAYQEALASYLTWEELIEGPPAGGIDNLFESKRRALRAALVEEGEAEGAWTDYEEARKGKVRGGGLKMLNDDQRSDGRVALADEDFGVCSLGCRQRLVVLLSRRHSANEPPATTEGLERKLEHLPMRWRPDDHRDELMATRGTGARQGERDEGRAGALPA